MILHWTLWLMRRRWIILEDALVFRPLVNQHPDASVTDSEKNIEFFFSHDMSCPVDGCPPAQLYATKASFQRHSTEKHLVYVAHTSNIN